MYAQLFRWTLIVISCSVLACAGKPKAPDTSNPNAPLPLFEGLGVHKYPVTTTNAEAQSYFNQGLVLAYAFNHLQAERSFNEAIKRDPSCAMCYWGAAFVLGPNINAPMSPEAEAKALDYLKKAQPHLPKATQKERDFIAALSKRYAEPVGQDRAERDQAFANAMKSLSAKYPDDAEASTIYAEAMMDQHPWDYWQKNGKPRPWTPAITKTLELTIKKHPDHAGAHHLYVHAMEASGSPERAVASADKLNSAVPAAGHLVHMPAHIYIRVGRYQDASNANLAAIKADQNQVAQSPGIYTMMYKPHNHHFLWASATLSGDQVLAAKAAEDTAARVRGHNMPDPAMQLMMQHFELTPLYHQVRFGKWEEILKRPTPKADDPIYFQGITHYAQAIAKTKTGKADEASLDLGKLDALRARPEVKGQMVAYNRLSTILEIASHMGHAEQLAAKGEPAAAAARLERAVKLEDNMTYGEPPDWHHPVRQVLGRMYLEAKQPKQAERVYMEDLKLFPRNVWSTTGLAQVYQALGDEQKAKSLREQVRQASLTSDIPASSF